MPAHQRPLATTTPWPPTPASTDRPRRHFIALGAVLTAATALLVAWPQRAPLAVPMEPLLASPVTGIERDWTLDFLRQTNTLHRLSRDGRIWVPQDRAATLRRQAQALGLAPAGAEPALRNPANRQLGLNGAN